MAFPVKCPWLSVNLLAKVRRSSCLLSRFNFLAKVRRSCLLCEGLAYLQLNFLGTSNFINWWRLARHFWYFLASFYTSGTPHQFVIFNPWKVPWNWIAFYQNSFVISPVLLYHLVRRDTGRLENEAFYVKSYCFFETIT